MILARVSVDCHPRAIDFIFGSERCVLIFEQNGADWRTTDRVNSKEP